MWTQRSSSTKGRCKSTRRCVRPQQPGQRFVPKGDVDAAIVQYQKALQIKPTTQKPATISATLCSKRAMWTKRSPSIKTVLQLAPDNPEATMTLAVLCSKREAWTKRFPISKRRCNSNQLRRSPKQSGLGVSNCSTGVATQRTPGRRTGPKGKSACRRKNLIFLRTLAAATPRRAIPRSGGTAQLALQAAEAQSKSALADDIRSQLTLYQAGTPFHSR